MGGGKLRGLQYVTAKGRLIINDHVEIFAHKVLSHPPKLSLGRNVSIGRYSIIGCANEISLEDNVRLAPYVHISDRNHRYEDLNTPIFQQPVSCPGPVIIKADTWIGFGAQIMPGVTIGKHCVIGAGSVVTKDIPDYCVVGGIPAKIIKRYSFKDKKWI